MLYCPKCKIEYEKTEKVCLKCGEKLISKNNETKANDKEKFLISVSEGFKAEMIEDSLRSAGIPFVRKGHGGPAGFSRYDTKYESLGVDFYVSSKMFERAKEVMPPVEDLQMSEEDNQGADDLSPDVDLSDNVTATESDEAPQMSPAKRLIGIVLFMVVIIIVVFGVDAIMNILRAFMGYK